MQVLNSVLVVAIYCNLYSLCVNSSLTFSKVDENLVLIKAVFHFTYVTVQVLSRMTVFLFLRKISWHLAFIVIIGYNLPKCF